MKIETTENYKIVTAENGKFIFSKAEEIPVLRNQVIVPLSAEDTKILEVFGEIDSQTLNPKEKRYSKLLLIRNLKAENLWDYIKNFIIKNGLKDEWDACTYITESDSMFQEMLNLLKVNHTQTFIDQMLNKSIY